MWVPFCALISTHHQLKVSQNDFGGHRMKALRETNHAIHQIELVLKHAKQVDKTAAKLLKNNLTLSG